MSKVSGEFTAKELEFLEEVERVYPHSFIFKDSESKRIILDAVNNLLSELQFDAYVSNSMSVEELAAAYRQLLKLKERKIYLLMCSSLTKSKRKRPTMDMGKGLMFAVLLTLIVGNSPLMGMAMGLMMHHMPPIPKI